MVQFHVGFDESHKERGKLASNYVTLRQILESEGFGVWEFSSFPITRQSLQNYDMLVFACTDSSKYSPEELEAIAQWVREDGGGLLLLSHAGGDRGRRSNMSELASQFGMTFENDQVLDQYNNFGIENMPNITSFPLPHPVNEGINSICYRAGCSVTIVGMAQSVAMSDGNAQPGSSCVIAAAEAGEGKVVAMGSYEIFRDEISGGIAHPNHVQLVKNIFEYLVTPKRSMLREDAYTSVVASENVVTQSNTATYQPSQSSTQQQGSKLVSVDLVNITSPQDLFKEIQNIAREVDVIRARIMNVYNVVAALSGGPDTGEAPAGTTGTAAVEQPLPAKHQPAALHASPPPSPPAASIPSQPNQDELLSLIQSKKDKKEEPATSVPPSISISSMLSELKSQQAARQAEDGVDRMERLKELSISQPGLGTVAPDEEMPPASAAPAPKEYKLSADDKRKSKAELEDEIDKLEAKIKSVENLKGFVEKKFKDGKIDEVQCKKEAGRFQADIDNTSAKITAYKQLLSLK